MKAIIPNIELQARLNYTKSYFKCMFVRVSINSCTYLEMSVSLRVLDSTVTLHHEGAIARPLFG